MKSVRVYLPDVADGLNKLRLNSLLRHAVLIALLHINDFIEFVASEPELRKDIIKVGKVREDWLTKLKCVVEEKLNKKFSMSRIVSLAVLYSLNDADVQWILGLRDEPPFEELDIS